MYTIITPAGKQVNPPPGRYWRCSLSQYKAWLADNRLWFGKDGTARPMLKAFLTEVQEGIRPNTWWPYDFAGHNKEAAIELKDLFGNEEAFSNPKPVKLIKRIADLMPDRKALVLDFFGGSGTTGHAVINLNRAAEDTDERRKYILCEMGAYFDTVLLPRLKKDVFAAQWKDGKPASRDAVSHTIKYHTLEQYEDTLNNLQLRPDAESQLAMDTFGEDYLLRYLLDFDTAGSPSLLNLAALADPLHYALRVKTGDDFVNQTVDLPETFSYLLGLSVRTVRAFRDNERDYRAIWGTDRQNRTVAHVWRKASDLVSDEAALKRDAAFVAGTVLPALFSTRPDRLFVNGTFAGIPDAQNGEPELFRLMFSSVTT